MTKWADLPHDHRPGDGPSRECAACQDYFKAEVADLPPLTDEQCRRVAHLLTAGMAARNGDDV